MRLDKNTKLSDLMYGHGDQFICTLSGKFQPQKFPGSPAIQLCELKCGCWIIADGNNRVGLILKENPDATLADIPTNLVSIEKFGTWDEELMEWWNPEPKSFKLALNNKAKSGSKNNLKNKSVIHGMIEKEAKGKFFAISHTLGVGKAITATGRTADETKRRLEDKIKTALNRKQITLDLRAMNQLEDHVCNRTA